MKASHMSSVFPRNSFIQSQSKVNLIVKLVRILSSMTFHHMFNLVSMVGVSPATSKIEQGVGS